MPRRPTTGSGSAAGYAPAAWLLAGAAQAAAAAPGMAPAENTPPAQAGTGSAVAGEVTPDTTAGAIIDDGHDDLTVFFSIGVVLDVLLVAAFLVWAVKQWRKTG